ncbi:CUB and sushi domain-containing protein 2, partial [Elysia marginata]
KQCNAPVIPENADLLTLGPGFYYNDSVELKCTLGYRLENPASGRLVCGSNRTWQGLQVTCQSECHQC